MELKKVIHKKILQETEFYECYFNEIDCDYFIKKIDEGIQDPTNLNNKTKVTGKMTSYTWFVNDEKLFKILDKAIELINPVKALPKLFLRNAWGIKIEQYEETQEHEHFPHNYSGVLYLNDTDNFIEFTELNLSVPCKKGNFILFKSTLLHKVKNNTCNVPKYGIGFNLDFQYMR